MYFFIKYGTDSDSNFTHNLARSLKTNKKPVLNLIKLQFFKLQRDASRNNYNSLLELSVICNATQTYALLKHLQSRSRRHHVYF